MINEWSNVEKQANIAKEAAKRLTSGKMLLHAVNGCTPEMYLTKTRNQIMDSMDEIIRMAKNAQQDICASGQGLENASTVTVTTDPPVGGIKEIMGAYSSPVVSICISEGACDEKSLF